MNKAGIYIHIPFCRKRCNYCDFYFITNLKLQEEFIKNLVYEIKISSHLYRDTEFNTIFFGGGTPSILTPIQLHKILNALHKEYKVSSLNEFTIESNPEDFINYENNLDEFRQIGINRVSLGVQSFIDSELRFLTREHSSQQAEDAINKIKDSFKNFSIDLIYSLPEQSISDVEYSLNKLIGLNVPHVSAYTLIYEEKTILYKQLKKNTFTPKDEAYESKLYEFVNEKLISEGFEHYEISNFAKHGYKSQHNLKYWEYEDYLGFGPSSHSFIKGKRWENIRSIRKYNESLIKGNLPIEKEEVLNKDMMKTEFIMLAMRSTGINFAKYNELFHENFKTEHDKAIKDLINNDYAVINKEKLWLNKKGFAIADEILVKYF
jgi:oxygen-independent coproporphyrinogen-3 oxidase